MLTEQFSGLTFTNKLLPEKLGSLTFTNEHTALRPFFFVDRPRVLNPTFSRYISTVPGLQTYIYRFWDGTSGSVFEAFLKSVFG